MTDDAARNRKRMAGVYAQHPEEMLEHAISVTMSMTAAMYQSKQHKQALFSICCDERMIKRAARKVMGHVLREMTSKHEPKREEFDTLVRAVAQLSRED